MSLCMIYKKYRGVESLCAEPATHFVTYFQDGGGGKHCCDKHLAKAVETVLNGPNAGFTDTVRVTPLKRKRKERAGRGR
jgi:hypothetical protein